MITKQPRNNEGYYDLKVTDKNGNAFIMTVGGNLDLYWVPQNYRKCVNFEIIKDDKMTYSVFEQLFDAVKKRDEEYYPVMKGNKITWISEDWPEDEANTLNIIKQKNSFAINFIQNKNREAWTAPHRGCTICFCNSGSRTPRVENLFMRMFNYLAYECELIECTSDEQQI